MADSATRKASPLIPGRHCCVPTCVPNTYANPYLSKSRIAPVNSALAGLRTSIECINARQGYLLARIVALSGFRRMALARRDTKCRR